MRAVRTALASVMFCVMLPVLALAADRAELEEFLEVTGFDVALESIRLSAESAPQMLGFEAEDFGTEWTRLTQDVFSNEIMHNLALDILAETLEDDLRTHAVDFYKTDLGQRLVIVENASHMSEEEALKEESGEAIIAGLASIDSPRLGYLERMTTASDSAGNAVRAIQEVQVRFLMAAAGAGVIEFQMDEADLRALLSTDEEAIKADIEAGALIGSAYTYQAFSDAEVLEYVEALENPKMTRVYDLMNAVQYEVMANRFEALAIAMERLQPSQEL